MVATIEDGNDRVLTRGHLEIRNHYGLMFETFPTLCADALGYWKVDPYVVQEELVTDRAGTTSPLKTLIPSSDIST